METTVRSETRSQATTTAASPYAQQAYRILKFGFTVAPIIAGLDKFLNLFVDWEQYLAPFVAAIIPAGVFMMIVGVVEIIAGIGVALKPRIFAYVVAAWLVGIIINLLLIPGYYDVALRDLRARQIPQPFRGLGAVSRSLCRRHHSRRRLHDDRRGGGNHRGDRRSAKAAHLCIRRGGVVGGHYHQSSAHTGLL